MSAEFGELIDALDKHPGSGTTRLIVEAARIEVRFQIALRTRDSDLISELVAEAGAMGYQITQLFDPSDPACEILYAWARWHRRITQQSG